LSEQFVQKLSSSKLFFLEINATRKYDRFSLLIRTASTPPWYRSLLHLYLKESHKHVARFWLLGKGKTKAEGSTIFSESLIKLHQLFPIGDTRLPQMKGRLPLATTWSYIFYKQPNFQSYSYKKTVFELKVFPCINILLAKFCSSTFLQLPQNE